MDARDPIDMRVGRIASLAEAAAVICTGSGMGDAARRETVFLDLVATAARLAAELERDTEGARYAGQ